MGLDVTAKCLNPETGFSCGYITYGRFIVELVRVAYGEDLAIAFEDRFNSFTNEEIAKWNAVCNDDLDLLIFHSDCDGKFSYQECGRIYKAMEDLNLKSDMTGHNYGVMRSYNMFEHWKEMFRLCWENRNTMYYC